MYLRRRFYLLLLAVALKKFNVRLE